MSWQKIPTVPPILLKCSKIETDAIERRLCQKLDWFWDDCPFKGSGKAWSLYKISKWLLRCTNASRGNFLYNFPTGDSRHPSVCVTGESRIPGVPTQHRRVDCHRWCIPYTGESTANCDAYTRESVWKSNTVGIAAKFWKNINSSRSTSTRTCGTYETKNEKMHTCSSLMKKKKTKNLRISRKIVPVKQFLSTGNVTG